MLGIFCSFFFSFRKEHKKIADIFVKKGPFLKLYSSYIRNFEHATALLDETCKKHNGFGMALQQFEVSSQAFKAFAVDVVLVRKCDMPCLLLML